MALKIRCGPVPADLETALQPIWDEAKLDELMDAALTCPNIEAFRARLAEQGPDDPVIPPPVRVV